MHVQGLENHLQFYQSMQIFQKSPSLLHESFTLENMEMEDYEHTSAF